MIRTPGRDYYGGSYDDPMDAAHAYDILAIKHHGEFAGLNFPEDRDKSASTALSLRPYDKSGVTLDGLTLPLSEWARRKGIPISAVRSRILRGWSMVDSLTLPTRRKARDGV